MSFDPLKQAAAPHLPDILSELLPAGSARGAEYLIGDEHGAAGDSCSVCISGERAGLWHDHASGHGGDLLDLIAIHHGPTVGHAARWLAARIGRQDLLNGAAAPTLDPMQLCIREDDAWIKPTRCWTYRDATGAVIGWVLRYDTPKGKTIRPAHVENGKPKLGGWRKPALKPIYGAHNLAARPDAPVLVVEGEKTCDAASRLFPDHVCITWMGGAESVQSADLAGLTGRTLVIWPDADKPGLRAANYLKTRFPEARVVSTAGLPEGWDLADPPPDGFDPVGRLHADPEEPKPTTEAPAPYRILGIADSEVFFHSYRSGDIITFAPQSMTELNLQLLAPDAHWISRGHTQDGVEVDYKSVAKQLIHQAHDIGRFSPDIIRGRGCWIDVHPVTHQTRVVFNAGDRIYVDGKLIEGQPDSRHCYRAGKPIPLDFSNPATDEDGRLLTRLCDLLPYSEETRRWILPAVLFLGPVCGSLDFRPGVWNDGEAGSGKSTLYKEYFGRLWAGCSYLFVGATSEAGIRQDTGSDAVPVIFDEAEARTTRATARLDAVLELIRQSSTETGGRIVKGSASGSAVTFEVRSMFALFSIAAPAMETADESRMARVTMTKKHDRAKYDEMKRLLQQITPEFCVRLRARAVLSVLRIREAYEIFHRAISDKCGSSRKGQQYGTLAAGMWCLENQGLPSPQHVKLFVDSQDWATLGAGTDDNSDQQVCLTHLLQHKTYWQDADGRRHDESIAGLIRMQQAGGDNASAAGHALNLIGLHVTASGLHVSNKNSGVAAVFRNTQFDRRWKDYLKRLPGAVEISFKLAGTKDRCIRFPVDVQ